MAEIRAFRGVRYRAAAIGDPARVVAAPYDVITPDAQDDYYRRSPYNVVRLELGSERADDTPSNNRYTRAAQLYRRWLQDQVLQPDERPGFYLYEESYRDGAQQHTRLSLFAPVRLARWDEGIILPHEFTLPGPKQDRLQLLEAARAQFSPLLGMYDDAGAILPLLREVAARPPTLEFVLEPGTVAAAAETHRLWPISDPALVNALVQAFEPLQIYVADGHHRYETALAYRDQQRQAGAGPDAPSEFALMALVETNDPGMLIRATHRVLRDLGPIDTAEVLHRLGESFEIQEASIDALTDNRGAGQSPSRPEFAILGLQSGRVHRLTLRPSIDLARLLPDVPAVLRTLDTVILQRLVLEPVFGLPADEIERGQRVDFTRDPDEAIRQYREGRAQLVIFLNPTPMDQIRRIARAGERMPQKTTYFYPKPVTGLVFYDHELAFADFTLSG